MITDEQVCIACAAYDSEHSQLAAMRKALETYEASKWVKFDADDLSTAPDSTADSLWSDAVIAITKENHEPQVAQYHYGKHRFDVNDVTRWQYLPTFKELS